MPGPDAPHDTPGARARVVRLVPNAVLLVLSVAGALALGELVLRAIAAGREVLDLRGLHEFQPERPWLYGLRPGARGRLAETGGALYEINADGFRGPRHERPKPRGTRRVVVLGDSVSFGYGVRESETFARVLERRLAQRAPQPVEIVNLGVGGYNAWNEARLLEDLGAGYEPDVVLVQFCINDLNDPTLHFDAQTRLALSSIPDEAFPDPSRRDRTARPPSRAVTVCRASRLCASLHDLWLAQREPEFDEARRRAAVLPVDGSDGPQWSWLEARYSEMAAAAEAAGARFVVLALPHPAQLDGSSADSRDRLVSMAAAHGWDVVDPLDAFRAAHARGTRVFLDWWHPTPAGHALLAGAIAEVLDDP